MKMRAVPALLALFASCVFPVACRNAESVELLRSRLNAAINESNRFDTARLLDELVRRGVDPKTLPVAESADLILSRVNRAYNWETITGDELVRLYGPLEGLQNGTPREHLIRGAYFWGLMGTGERKKALDLWRKSEGAVRSLLESPKSFVNYHIKLPREEMWLRSATAMGAAYFAIGFVSSKNPDDRRRGVELAGMHSRYYEGSLQEDVKSFHLDNPIAQAQITRLRPHESLLAHALVESGLAADPETNPFLKDEPPTTIRFEPVKSTGLEACGLRRSDGGYNRLALGDYDGDGYADVLVPDHGLWRNLGGGGGFRRVDDGLGLDVKGISGAFADVNNDGLTDVIVAGKGKFGVSLQTPGGIFRPVLDPAAGIEVNAAAIGLVDGDGDGLIDVFLTKIEEVADGKTVVLRNKGDGTFEDVTGAWGFKGEDILLPSEGVSPADYDDDGRVDIFVANYRVKRNNLWRNISDGTKTLFVECAAAPWFGEGERPEIGEGPDRGVEGWRSVLGNQTYWGHTSGGAWGDLNGDGTLDLVCANLSHPTIMLQNPGLIFDLSRVYLNTGHGFEDRTIPAGLVYRETNVSPLLADFNNDGRLDLSMTNCYSVWLNQFYEGAGDGAFREVTFRTGALASNAAAQAAADFDNDGDLDWFVIDGNKGLLLYENKLIDGGTQPAGANWVELELHGGRHVNRTAYGARVTVKANGRTYVREVAGMRGNSCGDDPVIHIGLGSYAGKVDAKIRWIGSRVQEISGLDVNKRHEIKEAE